MGAQLQPLVTAHIRDTQREVARAEHALKSQIDSLSYAKGQRSVMPGRYTRTEINRRRHAVRAAVKDLRHVRRWGFYWQGCGHQHDLVDEAEEAHMRALTESDRRYDEQRDRLNELRGSMRLPAGSLQ